MQTVTPKSCPKGCPSPGVCQLSTGKCLCQSTSTGLNEDCPTSNFVNETKFVSGGDGEGKGDDGKGGSSEPKPESVVYSMTVKNVEYSKLKQNSALLAKFSTAVKQGVAEAAGPDVQEEHVSLKLSAGSVVVEASITLPPQVKAATLKASLAKSPGTMAKSVTKSVTAVAGISAVTSGTVSVSGVEEKEKQSSTTSGSASGTTTGFGASASGVNASVSMSTRIVPAMLLFAVLATAGVTHP